MIGKHIHQARIAADMSKTELSDLSGVNADYIHAIETGTAKAPTWDKINRLIEALPLEIFVIPSKMVVSVTRRQGDTIMHLKK
jgi:transcriptional regulator with XRE-family HTH domain